MHVQKINTNRYFQGGFHVYFAQDIRRGVISSSAYWRNFALCHYVGASAPQCVGVKFLQHVGGIQKFNNDSINYINRKNSCTFSPPLH